MSHIERLRAAMLRLEQQAAPATILASWSLAPNLYPWRMPLGEGRTCFVLHPDLLREMMQETHQLARESRPLIDAVPPSLLGLRIIDLDGDSAEAIGLRIRVAKEIGRAIAGRQE